MHCAATCILHVSIVAGRSKSVKQFRVYYTYMDHDIRQFYDALFDLVGLLNQPQRDSTLLQEVGISLDRALFPLLVVIGRRDVVGIMELAGLVGRDHSTVSRQVATLDRLGLVTRRVGMGDGRERKVVATPEGLAIVSFPAQWDPKLGIHVT